MAEKVTACDICQKEDDILYQCANCLKWACEDCVDWRHSWVHKSNTYPVCVECGSEAVPY